eukprot:CAMPEP_0198151420 /NCGR_PEP_ID=MMETSP1443-20131203/55536_1 /TAXON_ID=186043 /ORGANISM="Entomoneis sp., Strain CCMP2396" /LENGTH=71 /DNA_ID=CAMNT_0043817069 /DNA_START=181 /DNA_END=396 /DNA_ORIENTATION=+
MAGGYPADMKVKKNIFYEEWNGQREITERTFELGFGDLPMLLMSVVIFPFLCYALPREELKKKDRRYKEVF